MLVIGGHQGDLGHTAETRGKTLNQAGEIVEGNFTDGLGLQKILGINGYPLCQCLVNDTISFCEF